MRATVVGRGNRALQHRHRLERVGARSRLLRLDVPQLPRSAPDQGLGVQAGHVEVVSEPLVHRAHRPGIVVGPDRAVVNRHIRLVAGCHRLDQRALRGPFGVAQPTGLRRSLMASGNRTAKLISAKAGQSLLKFGPTA